MQAANGIRWTAAEKATFIKGFDAGAADDRGYQEAKLDAYNALQSKQKSLQADENKLVGQLAKQSTHLGPQLRFGAAVDQSKIVQLSKHEAAYAAPQSSSGFSTCKL
jgi:hypothetical protein